MPPDEPTQKPLGKAWWILAYLLSPALPFLCLRVDRVIGTFECVLGVLAGLTAHLGFLSVLSQTNGEPLQIFISLLMGVSQITVFMWQYLAGQRMGYWSVQARRRWKWAGRFFGSVIGAGVVLNLLAFYLQHSAKG